MRPGPILALLIVAVVAIALIIASPWSSGGEAHNKATLITDFNKVVDEGGAPRVFQTCVASALSKSLTEAEVQHSYEQGSPSGRESSALGGLSMNSPAMAKVAEASLVCAQRLMKTGKYDQQQIARMLGGLSG